MNFYSIKITGKDVKRFIRNLYKMNINIYDIKYFDRSAIIKVKTEDYKKIKHIKTIYKVEIVNYYGINKTKHLINTYKIFLIFLVIGFIFLIFLTNIIFDVEVRLNNQELKESVLEELEKYKISKFHFVVSYNKKEKIKNLILTKFNDQVEWLEINRIGTKYVIELEERKKLNQDNDNAPRNIIAKKNGIVTKITSTHGEIVSKKDRYVKKGDILISGIIHKKEDIVDNIKAEGEVYAETWYTVTVELPYHYHEEEKTGKSSKYIKINFLNNDINLLDFKKYKRSKDNNIFTIKNFLLPISISFNKKEEIVVNDQIYTTDNAIGIASNISKNRLIKNLGENIDIIYEKNLKLEEKNSKIIVVMFYKIIENITDYSNIATSDENRLEIR